MLKTLKREDAAKANFFKVNKILLIQTDIKGWQQAGVRNLIPWII